MKKNLFLFTIIFILLSSFVLAEESSKTEVKCGVKSLSYSAGCLDGNIEGIRKALWQCYDGTISSDGSDSSCKSKKDFEDIANEMCRGKCESQVYISESVKCVFSNSDSENKCYSTDEKYSCSGKGTCVVEIKEAKNQKIDWKSSCGGYATTVTDGNNDYAEFSCVSDKEKACVDYKNMDSCLDNKVCSWDQETSSCINFQLQNSCSDPDGGDNIFKKAHTFGYRSTYADSRDKRIRTGGLDSCLSETQLVEHSCDGYGFIQTANIDCLSQCKNGECIQEPAKEEIKCVFKGSDKDQKCYAATADTGKKFSSCTGRDSCTLSVEGYKGEKLTWKSSCGGYQYTKLDGKDETIEFTCSSKIEITPIDIQEAWFRNSYWQCYDGTGGGFEKSEESSSCKPSELWQTYAKESCDNHCSKDGSKCGVNSFSVSNYCYPEKSPQQPTTSTKEEILVPTSGAADIQKSSCDDYAKDCKLGYESACFKWKENCYSIESTQQADAKEILICKDSCPLNGKCYPFGYRKSSNFCSDEGGFIKQLSSADKCENNFECSSNVCASDKCVSQGFLDKVYSWFKRLFGGE